MKKVLLALCVTLATVSFASAQTMDKKMNGKMKKNPTVGGAAMFSNKTIVDNAVNSPIHKTLVVAVTKAELVDTLKGAGPFTVFAPTDTAFGKLPAGTVDTLVMPENKQMLTGILTYHVVPGMLDSKAIAKQIKAGGGSAQLTTVAGGTLTATMDGKTLVLTDAKGGKSVNLPLSRERATAVKDWLVKNGGVAAPRISAEGFGEENPVAPNTMSDGKDDPVGRARNRRVSIIVEKPPEPTP